MQLMKEVREGLILAMTHRERFNKHINTALHDKEDSLEKYMMILGEFDATVKEVLWVCILSENKRNNKLTIKPKNK